MPGHLFQSTTAPGRMVARSLTPRTERFAPTWLGRQSRNTAGESIDNEGMLVFIMVSLVVQNLAVCVVNSTKTWSLSRPAVPAPCARATMGCFSPVLNHGFLQVEHFY